MSTGKLIEDVPVSRVRGSMKIPVNGNRAISPLLIKKKLEDLQGIYLTNDPHILESNGLVQDLKLTQNGVLEFTGKFVFVRVECGYELNIDQFLNPNGYTRDKTKDALLCIIDNTLFGFDYKVCTGGGDGGNNPPTISCANATDSMSFIQVNGDWNVYVDGSSTPLASDSIAVCMSNILSAYPNKIIGDYYGFLYIQNIDSVDHRFRFTPISGTSFTPDRSNGNESFTDAGDGSFYFCLKGTNSHEIPEISCAGATNHVYFNSIYGSWDVYLDGFIIYSGISSGSIINTLKSDYPSDFIGDYDTYLIIENISNEYHRFMFVPVDGGIANYQQDSNPTLGTGLDGAITFCLAPKPIQSYASFLASSSWNGMDSTGMPKYFRLYNQDTNTLLVEVDLGTSQDIGIADLSLVSDGINSAGIGLYSTYNEDGNGILNIMFSTPASPVRKFRMELHTGNEGSLELVSGTLVSLTQGDNPIIDPYVAIFEMKPLELSPVPPM